MSHTVKIEGKFKTSEVGVLAKAFGKFNWGFVENATSRQYSGPTRHTYRYVAINPEKRGQDYDIGINVNGEFLEMFSDPYGGSINRQLGDNMERLKQEFAACVIEDEFPNATVLRTVGEKGALELEVEQW